MSHDHEHTDSVIVLVLTESNKQPSFPESYFKLVGETAALLEFRPRLRGFHYKYWAASHLLSVEAVQQW